MEDVTGRSYLDCLSGAGALALGHYHPVVEQAIQQMWAERVPFQTLDLTTPVKDRFVEALYATLPKAFADQARIQFCGPSGADAIEAALKLVKTATGRRSILAFQGAYHGMTHGALGFNGGYRPEGGRVRIDAGSAFSALSLWLSLPLRYGRARGRPRGGRVCGTGVGGLIIDEVQTGIGRTGRMYAFEQAGILPDVLVLSKAIGGGLPLSVVVYHQDLDVWQPGAHAGTFRGNQMAMAAGAATLRFIKENAFDRHAAAMGERLMGHLRFIQQDVPGFGDVRGRGLMIGVEVVEGNGKPDSAGAYPPSGTLARRIQAECLARGLLLETGGRQGGVVRFMPPLIVTAAEVDRIASIFHEAVMAAHGLPGEEAQSLLQKAQGKSNDNHGKSVKNGGFAPALASFMA